MTHSWITTDEGHDCQNCGLHVDDGDRNYPLSCGVETECSVVAEDGRSQAHHIVAAVYGTECYHCGCTYA